MSIVDDSDFLTNRTKQLNAVNELAHQRTRMVDLQAELLTRMNERRQIIQRLAEQDLVRQREAGRASRTAVGQRARASEEVRVFDQNLSALRERIRRIEIDVERLRLSIDVAISGGPDRMLGLVDKRGAA